MTLVGGGATIYIYIYIYISIYIYIYIYLRDAQRKPDLVKPNAVLLRPGGADFLIASFCFRFRAFVLFGLLTSIQHLPTIVYICWLHKCRFYYIMLFLNRPQHQAQPGSAVGIRHCWVVRTTETKRLQ